MQMNPVQMSLSKQSGACAVRDIVEDGQKHDVSSEHRDESKLTEAPEHPDESKIQKSHQEHRDKSKFKKGHHLREVVDSTAGRLGLPTGVTAVEQSQANGRAGRHVRALRERSQLMVRGRKTVRS